MDEKIIGIGAHTDYGTLTILAQDSVGGLQVMNRDDAWVEGTPIPGTFVINIGDLVQKLTNDLYLANLHGVVNTSGRERYSIPFFVDADYDAVSRPWRAVSLKRGRRVTHRSPAARINLNASSRPSRIWSDEKTHSARREPQGPQMI
ncbi:2OG-Fe(II) oxygenase family protein [Mesorhizobium sp. PL10]